MAFHTADQTYQCKWCNKSFDHSAELIEHVTSEHEIDESTPLSCIVCTQTFTNASQLLYHLREHAERQN